MNAAICFSGGIASGKTTLASAVAVRLGLQVATFGGYVRSEARRRGAEEHREALQALGEALIGEMGWISFCTAVLEEAGWTPGNSIVVDGIRHVAALEAVRAIVNPMPTKLFLVAVAQAVRQDRNDNRPQERTELAKADLHSTERDVHQSLPDLADLVLDGTRDPDALVEEVLLTLGKSAHK
ncbi:MAG: AAA family ATPase [Pseudomonadota bacterium]